MRNHTRKEKETIKRIIQLHNMYVHWLVESVAYNHIKQLIGIEIFEQVDNWKIETSEVFGKN